MSDEMIFKKNIVIIDNDEIQLFVLSSYLENLFHIMTFRSGLPALYALESMRILPDCILLDYAIPGTDGLEIIQKLKANERLKKIPIIILTSVSKSDSVIGCLLKNPASYLLKPIEADVLIDRIFQIIS